MSERAPRGSAASRGASPPIVSGVAHGGGEPSSSACRMRSDARSSTSYQDGTFVTARALSAGALERHFVDVGSAPRDAGENLRVRLRQADQRVAAVERGAQHHIVATSHRVHGGAKDRAGQGGAVGVHQHRAGVALGEQVSRRLDEALAEVAAALEQEAEAGRQQLSKRRLRARRRVDGVAGATSAPSEAMVAATSRMKQAESPAHCSAVSGGDSRVFDWPAIGVLQTMATATVFTASISRIPAIRADAGDPPKPWYYRQNRQFGDRKCRPRSSPAPSSP